MNPNKQRWCLWKKRIVGSKGSRLKNKSGWGGQEKEAFLSFFKRRLLLSFFLSFFLPSFLLFFLSFFLSCPDFVFFDPRVLPSFRDSFLVFSHVFWILFFFDPYLFFFLSLFVFFWSLFVFFWSLSPRWHWVNTLWFHWSLSQLDDKNANHLRRWYIWVYNGIHHSQYLDNIYIWYLHIHDIWVCMKMGYTMVYPEVIAHLLLTNMFWRFWTIGFGNQNFGQTQRAICHCLRMDVSFCLFCPKVFFFVLATNKQKKSKFLLK